MTRSENMLKEGGCDESASGELVQSSRRVQGLLPEERRTLDEVKRDNRKRNAALRKAAQEARDLQLLENRKQSRLALTRTKRRRPGAPRMALREFLKRTLESRIQKTIPKWEFEESDEESVVEVMVKTEPSAEDRVTDSPQRPNEVDFVQEKIDVKVERPLSTVQEEVVSEDMEVSPALTETPSN
ncbi:hypothetical protein PHMEG_00027260 [Phytophthora megakarya]|uniref:Uncharacterized protein n=1 Tax=Phytophthora megakarya TaxID=4795 RepID=A0A225V9A1_9STRA|nr:hypothetical protein PHMEG_00027260 [Phytophthora megakarya]